MSELPKGWVNTKLSDIAQWGSGGTPSRTNTLYYGGTIPWVKTGELGQGLIMDTEEKLTELGMQNSSAKLFPKGSVAIAMYGATIGKTAILGIDATTNQACAVGIPKQGITTTKYLFYYLSSQKDAFIDAGKGGAQPNISQGVIKEWPIPLAPLAEQKRIADKLDALLARVDGCRARLARVPAILKRFRQAVLAAATSGALTADWRENSQEVNGRNQLHSTPYADLENANDQEPPQSWYWERFADLVTNCDNRRIPIKASDRAKRQGSYPYYGAFGIIDHIDDYRYDGEFLLVAEDGKNLESRQRPIALIATGKFWVNNHAHVLEENGKINLKYLSLYLNSPSLDLQPFLTGIDQVKLTRSAMDQIPIPVPPIEEQHEIVRHVETLFSYADRLEARYAAAAERMEQLTPALLAKAFRGELVAQDPADEPAALLLARVQAARGAVGESPLRRRSVID